MLSVIKNIALIADIGVSDTVPYVNMFTQYFSEILAITYNVVKKAI